MELKTALYRKPPVSWAKVSLMTLGALALASGLGLGVAGAVHALSAESGGKPPTADYGNEGWLLAAPHGGPSKELLGIAEPSVMSVVFADRKVAQEFYDEAVSNGERVCLSDLGGARSGEFHGQRYWLFSC